MENKQLLTLVLVLIIGFGAGYIVAPRYSPMGIHKMPDRSMMSNGSMMQDSMMGMMVGLNGKTGDAFDQAFLTEMIMHHEGAVQMAEAALRNAKHSELKTMANAIISAQTTEIDQMRDWLEDWFNQ
jgi:uncharacterized protein (DUF305 family)